jgi:hypothetical protein
LLAPCSKRPMFVLRERVAANLALEGVHDLVRSVADQRKAIELLVAAEELQALLGSKGEG